MMSFSLANQVAPGRCVTKCEGSNTTETAAFGSLVTALSTNPWQVCKKGKMMWFGIFILAVVAPGTLGQRYFSLRRTEGSTGRGLADLLDQQNQRNQLLSGLGLQATTDSIANSDNLIQTNDLQGTTQNGGFQLDTGLDTSNFGLASAQSASIGGFQAAGLGNQLTGNILGNSILPDVQTSGNFISGLPSSQNVAGLPLQFGQTLGSLSNTQSSGTNALLGNNFPSDQNVLPLLQQDQTSGSVAAQTGQVANFISSNQNVAGLQIPFGQSSDSQSIIQTPGTLNVNLPSANTFAGSNVNSVTDLRLDQLNLVAAGAASVTFKVPTVTITSTICVYTTRTRVTTIAIPSVSTTFAAVTTTIFTNKIETTAADLKISILENSVTRTELLSVLDTRVIHSISISTFFTPSTITVAKTAIKTSVVYETVVNTKLFVHTYTTTTILDPTAPATEYVTVTKSIFKPYQPYKSLPVYRRN